MRQWFIPPLTIDNPPWLRPCSHTLNFLFTEWISVSFFHKRQINFNIKTFPYHITRNIIQMVTSLFVSDMVKILLPNILTLNKFINLETVKVDVDLQYMQQFGCYKHNAIYSIIMQNISHHTLPNNNFYLVLICLPSYFLFIYLPLSLFPSLSFFVI